MFQVSITLPTVQHNGTSNLDTILGIQQDIAKFYGGFTAQNVAGGWFDQETGRFYPDTSILVYTLVETEQDVEELLERSRKWARDLQQIELLVTVQGPLSVYFVKGTRNQAVA